MNPVQKRVLREIDERVAKGPVRHDGSFMRSRLRSAVALQADLQLRMAWVDACGKNCQGEDYMNALSSDELEAFLYALAWCRAWGRDLQEYIETFGVGTCRELA